MGIVVISHSKKLYIARNRTRIPVATETSHERVCHDSLYSGQALNLLYSGARFHPVSQTQA
jgi:hypothetical protein